MKKEFKKAESGEVFKFEKAGDYIEGVLVGVEESKMFEGSYALTFRSPDDKMKVAFVNEIPVKKINHNALVGREVRVEFIGKKKSAQTGREYNDFDVLFV